jgi:flagellin
MIIKHNISASNANRMLGINNNNVAKSIEKISSGYRINRAADDAAGLAISEKMRSRIRGLDQGSINSQDGISLLQTADGGMQEIQDMLQRCRELSVKSATGTYNDEDRNSIQEEVSQLIDEIDRTANETEFNGYALLSGNFDKKGNTGTSDSIANYVSYITTTGGVTDKYTYTDGTKYASAVIDFSKINSSSDVANLVGKGVNYTCCTCNKVYSIKFVNGTPNTSRLNDSNPVMEVDVSSITNGTDLVNKIIETGYGQPGFVYNPTIPNGGEPTPGTDVPATATSFVTHYSQLAASGAKLYVYDDRISEAGGSWPSSSGRGAFNLSVYGETPQEKGKFFYADIQVGDEAGESVRIEVQNVTPKELGVDKLLLNTKTNAQSAIDKIDNAISIVSNSRSIVGAHENRLGSTIASTNNTSENLQSAESRIRDVDVAKEMMKMATNSILQQSSESVLNQSNKMLESVLNLMKQWQQS